MVELAASYVGAVVGAGFASGQEHVHFFCSMHTQWETEAFAASPGVLWAGGLFVLFGAALGELASKHHTSSSRDFIKQLIPWPLCMIYDCLMTFFIFWSLSIMLAGSGALFTQSMGFSSITGIFFTAMFSVLATAAGIDGVLAVNLIMSPFMLAMPIVVAMLSIWKKAQGLLLPAFTGSLVQWTSAHTHSWPLSALLYVSYNILLAVGVFASMGKDIPDNDIGRRGGILGGIGLMFFLIAIESVLAAHGESVFVEELPMLTAASSHGVLIARGYSLALWFAMATTSVCGVFTLSQRLSKYLPLSKLGLIITITAAATIPAQLGFAKLVGTIYPIIGYIGLPILVSVLFQFLKTRRNSS